MPVRRLSPKWNNFVFFEVTPKSYHQVAEVLSQDKSRLTVNGWFRGPKADIDATIFIESYPDLVKCGSVEVEEAVLRSWVSETYLDDDTQLQVMCEFKATSEISLPTFLNRDKYQQMCQLLADDSLDWELVGPPNRRHYHRLNLATAPSLAKEMVQVFQSEAMFLTISNLSGIKFHPLAADTSESEEEEEEDEGIEKGPRPEKPVKVRNPRVSLEIRKWTKGCYTVVHDHDPEVLDDQSKLDCILHFDHDNETNRDHGGFMSYIAKDADEELLTIEPSSNTLALVYRDNETARFMKFVNDSHPHTFYDLSLVFHE